MLVMPVLILVLPSILAEHPMKVPMIRSHAHSLRELPSFLAEHPMKVPMIRSHAHSCADPFLQVTGGPDDELLQRHRTHVQMQIPRPGARKIVQRAGDG